MIAMVWRAFEHAHDAGSTDPLLTRDRNFDAMKPQRLYDRLPWLDANPQA